MMGEPFFNCQIGFVGCRALCLKGIMGVLDFEENVNRREEVKKKSLKLKFPQIPTLLSHSIAYEENSLYMLQFFFPF